MDSTGLIAIGIAFILLVLAGVLFATVRRRRRQPTGNEAATAKEAEKVVAALIELDNYVAQLPKHMTIEDMNNDDLMEGFIAEFRKEWMKGNVFKFPKEPKLTNREKELGLFLFLNDYLIRQGCDPQRVRDVLAMNRKYK